MKGGGKRLGNSPVRGVLDSEAEGDFIVYASGGATRAREPPCSLAYLECFAVNVWDGALVLGDSISTTASLRRSEAPLDRVSILRKDGDGLSLFVV